MYFFIAAGKLALRRSNPWTQPPVVRVLSGRVRFGPGSGSIVLTSNQRLATPPQLAGFTFVAGYASGGAWNYSYGRTDVMAPLSGEQVGQSKVNALTVLSPAVNEAGLEQDEVQGTYQLYGWIGQLQVVFPEPYVLRAALQDWQRQALVDPGPVVATSDGTDSPDWQLCDATGTPAAAPAATHLQLTDPELMNASGTLDLYLSTP